MHRSVVACPHLPAIYVKYQIILLDNRGTRVWTNFLGSLHSLAVEARDLLVRRPLTRCANTPLELLDDHIHKVIPLIQKTRAQQLLRWATVWPQSTWAEKWWGAAVGLGPHLLECGLGRGLPLYQMASWSIQPFGHNYRNATLLHVGIPLRIIFIPSLVAKHLRYVCTELLLNTN